MSDQKISLSQITCEFTFKNVLRGNAENVLLYLYSNWCFCLNKLIFFILKIFL